jgi:hypothetical protein
MNDTQIRRIAVIVIIVGVLILVLYAALLYYSKEVRYSPSYLSQPEHWILKQDGILHISVGRATGDRAQYKTHGVITYNDGEIRTAFQSAGFYDGELFAEFYEGEEAIIEIGPNMDPDNTVAEIFIIETFENGIPYFMIFVDEEWVERWGSSTWYHWGANFSQSKKANPREINKGIYYEKLRDEFERFVEESEGNYQKTGGLLVGNIHRDDWFKNNLDSKVVIHFW